MPPRVLSAAHRPGHLDPAFVGMMDELRPFSAMPSRPAKRADLSGFGPRFPMENLLRQSGEPGRQGHRLRERRLRRINDRNVRRASAAWR